MMPQPVRCRSRSAISLLLFCLYRPRTSFVVTAEVVEVEELPYLCTAGYEQALYFSDGMSEFHQRVQEGSMHESECLELHHHASGPASQLDYFECARFCSESEGCVGFQFVRAETSAYQRAEQDDYATSLSAVCFNLKCEPGSKKKARLVSLKHNDPNGKARREALKDIAGYHVNSFAGYHVNKIISSDVYFDLRRLGQGGVCNTELEPEYSERELGISPISSICKTVCADIESERFVGRHRCSDLPRHVAAWKFGDGPIILDPNDDTVLCSTIVIKEYTHIELRVKGYEQGARVTLSGVVMQSRAIQVEREGRFTSYGVGFSNFRFDYDQHPKRSRIFFRDDKSILGAVLYLDDGATASFHNATLENNLGAWMGGVAFQEPRSTLTFTDCDILNNGLFDVRYNSKIFFSLKQTNEVNGGVVGTRYGGEYIGTIFERCNIKRNSAPVHGGVYTAYKADGNYLKIVDSVVVGNRAGVGGGVLHVLESSMEIIFEGSEVRENMAGSFGAVAFLKGKPLDTFSISSDFCGVLYSTCESENNEYEYEYEYKYEYEYEDDGENELINAIPGEAVEQEFRWIESLIEVTGSVRDVGDVALRDWIFGSIHAVFSDTVGAEILRVLDLSVSSGPKRSFSVVVKVPRHSMDSLGFVSDGKVSIGQFVRTLQLAAKSAHGFNLNGGSSPEALQVVCLSSDIWANEPHIRCDNDGRPYYARLSAEISRNLHFIAKRSVFEWNRNAQIDGAVFYAVLGTTRIEILDGSIIRNNVAMYGGVFHVEPSDNQRICGVKVVPLGSGDRADESSSIIIKNSTIEKNEARQHGGVVYGSGSYEISVQNSFVIGNTADSLGGVLSVIQGSGLYASFSDSVIKQNSASSGGVLHVNSGNRGRIVFSSTRLSFKRCRIEENQAQSDGGVLNLMGWGQADFDGGLLVSNKAAGKGGLAYVTGGSILRVSSLVLDKNTAQLRGGAVALEATPWCTRRNGCATVGVFADVIVEYNSCYADGCGGGFIAVLSENVDLHVRDSVLRHNEAKEFGGGVMIALGAGFHASNVRFVANVATYAHGGGGGAVAWVKSSSGEGLKRSRLQNCAFIGNKGHVGNDVLVNDVPDGGVPLDLRSMCSCFAEGTRNVYCSRANVRDRGALCSGSTKNITVATPPFNMTVSIDTDVRIRNGEPMVVHSGGFLPDITVTLRDVFDQPSKLTNSEELEWQIASMDTAVAWLPPHSPKLNFGSRSTLKFEYVQIYSALVVTPGEAIPIFIHNIPGENDASSHLTDVQANIQGLRFNGCEKGSALRPCTAWHCVEANNTGVCDECFSGALVPCKAHGSCRAACEVISHICEENYFLPNAEKWRTTVLPSNSNVCIRCPNRTGRLNFAPSVDNAKGLQIDKCLPQCPPGRYSNTGLVPCTNCPVMTQSESSGFGSRSCMPSQPGYFSDEKVQIYGLACNFLVQKKQTDPIAEVTVFVCRLGLATGKPCPVGHMCPDSGMLRPRKCPSGWFATRNASLECVSSGAGSYVPNEGMAEPVPCPKGHACGDTAMQAPVECTAGTFAQANGSHRCTKSPPGFYAPASGLYAAMSCPPGHECPREGMTAPLPCKEDFFQSSSGAAFCSSCVAERFGSKTFGVTGVDSVEGCFLCPENARCDSSTVLEALLHSKKASTVDGPSTSSSTAVCPVRLNVSADTYRFPPDVCVASEEDGSCSECYIVGYTCRQCSASAPENLRYKCPIKASGACLADKTLDEARRGLNCAKGSAGVFCASCIAGYARSVTAGAGCFKCPSTPIVVLVTLLALLIFAVVICTLIYLHIHDGGEQSYLSEILKVVTLHLQVLGILESFPLTWPESVNAFFFGSKVLSVSSEGGQIGECVFHGFGGVAPVYVMTLIAALAPVVSILASICYWWARSSASYIGNLVNRVARRKTLSHVHRTERIVVSALTILFLLQMLVVKQAMRLVTCTEYLYDEDNNAGHSFLQDDTRIECYVGPHLVWFLVLGLPLILAAGLGFPFLLFRTVRVCAMDFERSKTVYGFLYTSFKPNACYWEVARTSRTFLFVVASVALEPIGADVQALTGVIVITFFLALHIYTMPFIDPRLNVLDTIAQVTQWTTLVSGLFLFSTNISEGMRHVLTWFIVVQNVAFVIFAARRAFQAVKALEPVQQLAQRIGESFTTTGSTNEPGVSGACTKDSHSCLAAEVELASSNARNDDMLTSI